ncbi:unnamed protein product [Mesocestoides corti]|uniref:Uncharacterized protein n=2 Tax=Mesocestoides corti TaxID=53468 RepID=A0A0R3UBA1_MESCO|nr:unnamed protein product [Mesocestoides corti]
MQHHPELRQISNICPWKKKKKKNEKNVTSPILTNEFNDNVKGNNVTSHRKTRVAVEDSDADKECKEKLSPPFNLMRDSVKPVAALSPFYQVPIPSQDKDSEEEVKHSYTGSLYLRFLPLAAFVSNQPAWFP